MYAFNQLWIEKTQESYMQIFLLSLLPQQCHVAMAYIVLGGIRNWEIIQGERRMYVGHSETFCHFIRRT